MCCSNGTVLEMSSILLPLLALGPKNSCSHLFLLLSSSTVEPGSCTHNGKIYKDKAYWRPEKCVLCLCEHGYPVCDVIVCSDVSNCPNAIVSPGECCAVCPGSGMSYSISPSYLLCHPIPFLYFLLTARTVTHTFSYTLVFIHY